MKSLNYMKNQCILFYIRVWCFYSRYHESIVNITVFIIYIIYVIFFVEPLYCASDSGESCRSLELKRHPEDTGESTIRLVSLDKKSSDINNQKCETASMVSGRASDDWSTRATVGVKDNSEITSVCSQSLAVRDNTVSIGSLRNRIQDTIALYGGNSNSTMLGEMSSHNDTLQGETANMNTVDTQQSREQSIRMYTDVLVDQARSSRDPNQIQYLGALLQELRQVAIANGLEVNERPLDLANNSELSIQTNISDPYNIERRREIIREKIISDVDQQLDINPKQSDLVRYGSENQNKLIEIKSKIINIYNKYYISGKRRVFWLVVEKYTDNYESYQQYKETWENDLSIRKQVKSLIKDEVQKLVDKNNPFGTNKDVYRKR